jgi:hypothetical protein
LNFRGSSIQLRPETICQSGVFATIEATSSLSSRDEMRNALPPHPLYVDVTTILRSLVALQCYKYWIGCDPAPRTTTPRRLDLMDYPGYYDDASYGMPDGYTPNNYVPTRPHLGDYQHIAESGIRPVDSGDEGGCCPCYPTPTYPLKLCLIFNKVSSIEMTADQPLHSPPGPENYAFTPRFGQAPVYGLTQPREVLEHWYDPRLLPYPVPLLDISVQKNGYVTSTSLPPTALGWHNGNSTHQPTQGPYGGTLDMEPQESLSYPPLAPLLQHNGTSLPPQLSQPPPSCEPTFKCRYPGCQKIFKRIARAEACLNGHLQQKPYRCAGACGIGAW